MLPIKIINIIKHFLYTPLNNQHNAQDQAQSYQCHHKLSLRVADIWLPFYCIADVKTFC